MRPAAAFLAGCSEWPLVETPFLGAIGGRRGASSARGLRNIPEAVSRDPCTQRCLSRTSFLAWQGMLVCLTGR
jgi:hypothetical protein